MVHQLRATILSIFIFLLLLGAGGARDVRNDPATGRIRVIYIGDAIGVSNPFPILNQEPLLFCTAVYATTIHQHIDTIKRSFRLYMPRIYSKFLANDVVILSDANKDAFRTEHFRWMKEGVLDEGLGLVMVGGAESFAQEGGYPSWQPTEVAEILPCEMIPTAPKFSGGRLRILDEEDEFIRSLPFQTIGAYGVFGGSNNILPLSRANLVAELIQGTLGTTPFLMWFDIGEGRTMAQSADWTPAGGNIFMRWDYYGDYAINMAMFLAGMKMPDDLETVYLVRRRLRETTEAIGMLYNMVEIIDKFGGSSATLDQMMAELRDERERGLSEYFQADLDGALGAFASALQKSEDTMNEAIRVRNAAAFWIFFTEWCVVTGTSLFTGAVLWMLMVRRRLYREVRITKLRQVDE
jgi:uncharacterized membrane protein